MPDKIHFMGDSNRGPRGGLLYCFHCPGCEYGHPFEVCENNDGWTWNGSLDKPTFTPSLLVAKDTPTSRCHSFVTDGRIQFVSQTSRFVSRNGLIVSLKDLCQKST